MYNWEIKDFIRSDHGIAQNKSFFYLSYILCTLLFFQARIEMLEENCDRLKQELSENSKKVGTLQVIIIIIILICRFL